MTELEKKIYETVRKIPRGKVATYGQIAETVGNRKLARVVGNVMHKNPVPFWSLANSSEEESNAPKGFMPVPCHRVVNASGKMGGNFGLGGPEVQAEMLRKEGVPVSSEKLQIEDLGSYLVDKL